MSYELYRAGSTDDEHSKTHLLGTYATVQTAVDARDDHVLSQLELTRGRQIELTHLIVGPGRDGERTSTRSFAQSASPSAGRSALPPNWPTPRRGSAACTGRFRHLA